MQSFKNMLHPWHISIGEKYPGCINAIIEIPKQTRLKYELDKPSGMLYLDRILEPSISYPENYGLIPQTYFDDGDPLDILVLCSYPLVPLCIIPSKVIGLMEMEDEKGKDDKIIAVADGDPLLKEITEITDLPAGKKAEIRHFFENYKQLENKPVTIGAFKDRKTALACIEKSFQGYKKKFSDV